MKLQFINSLPLEVISGGNIYNRAIIEGFSRKGIHVEYSSQVYNKDYDITIIDSLIMGQIETSILNSQKPIIALIHQVPVLDQHTISFYRSNTKIVVTGEPAKHDLIEHWNIEEKNIKVIRPGLPDYWKPRRTFVNRPKEIIINSNVLEGKGYELLIEIMKQTSHLDLTFKIIGNDQLDDIYASKIVNKIKALNFDVKFHFNIDHPKVYELLLASDIFLNVSESETFGMSIFEALSVGIPCVCTTTGDLTFFKNLNNYFPIENRSSVVFVHSLKELVSNPNTYSNYCNSKVVNSRNWKTVTEEFLAWINYNS